MTKTEKLHMEMKELESSNGRVWNGESCHFHNEQDWVSDIKIDPLLVKREQSEKTGTFGKDYMDDLFERY